MVRFTVVTCIGENGFEFDSRRSLLNQTSKFTNIRVRSLARFKCKNEMVGHISDDAELGVTPVGDRFSRAFLGRTAFDEVRTCVGCTEPG